MVEEAAAAVPFAEALDLLDVIRNWLQQVMQLRLKKKKKKKGGSRRDSRRMKEKRKKYQFEIILDNSAREGGRRLGCCI